MVRESEASPLSPTNRHALLAQEMASSAVRRATEELRARPQESFHKARPLKYFGYLWTIFLLSILKTAKDRSMTSMTHLQPFTASIARWYFSDQRLGSLRRWEAWEACGPGSRSRVECPGAADCCPTKSNSNSYQNIQKCFLSLNFELS